MPPPSRSARSQTFPSRSGTLIGPALTIFGHPVFDRTIHIRRFGRRFRSGTSACERRPSTERSFARAPSLLASWRSLAQLCLLTTSFWAGTTGNAQSTDSPADAPSQKAPPESKGDKQAELADKQAQGLERWKKDGLPLMQTYCVDCHNEDLQEGGLDLSPFQTMTDLSPPEVQRVLDMVRFGAMPPEDYDTPEIEERKQLVAALETTLFSSTCDLNPRAGKVTVRRLNRSEYNNTIRDLFGMDLKPAEAFPSDEVGGGFDNNGDVLSLSPMLIEKYIEAAESVSAQVVIDPSDLVRLSKEIPGDQLAIYGEPQIGRFGGRFVDRSSFAWMDVDVPFDGDYRVQVRGGLSADRKGDKKNEKDMRVAICDDTGLVLADDTLQYFGGSGGSDSMQETVRLPQGKHRLFFVPLNGGHDLDVGKTKLDQITSLDQDELRRYAKQTGKTKPPAKNIDRDEYPFMFRQLSISGPRNHPDEAYPPKQFKIVRHVAPRKRDRYYNVLETAVKNLQPLMTVVFRGPVSEEDVKPYAELVEQAVNEGLSYHRGTQVALSAMLVSPRFLFRVEMPAGDAKPNEQGDVPLSHHQVATRLSYFLWSSTPDSSLMEQADRNQLNPDRLASQVKRMIKDRRADALAADFASQWLGLRNLDSHEADAKRFPAFDRELRSAMSQETQLLFLHVLRNNLPVKEFLTADYTFVNPVLAKHYGIESDEEAFSQISLKDTPRRGILSHASVLTLTSTPNRTSPVLRGKWILENILGTKAPEPPAGVPELESNESVAENATLREQFELHRSNPTCASCHRVMDQLGFGLDDFDAIGKFRVQEAGKPINASGALPDGRSFNGGAELSQMLGETETEAFARSLIERLMTFAIGRELTPNDRCTIDEIYAATQPDQFRLADIVSAIATSRQFRFQTAETIAATPDAKSVSQSSTRETVRRKP